jgi:hypothetical protein
MRNRRSIDILALLTAGSALAVVVLVTNGGFGPPVDGNVQAEIGRTLAREALSLSRPGGDILLITRDTEAFPQPAPDLVVESFQREVKNRAGNITVITQSLQLDPLRPVEVPPGDFYEFIRRSKEGRVIVSLLGPPALTKEQRDALGAVNPRIIALCTGHLAQSMDLRDLFDAGLLRVAVVNQPAPQGAGNERSRGPVTFDRLYTVVRGGPASPREAASARR